MRRSRASRSPRTRHRGRSASCGARRAFPLNPVDFDALAAPPTDGVQAVWVGHATVLVQMEGLTFLTHHSTTAQMDKDPVFSERASPFTFLGPKRLVAPALDAASERLPHLDFVVISHNHYDHLDTASVKALHKRYGPQLTWYVPLGIKAWFTSCGVRNVVEMDWWQEVMHGDTKVAVCMVPAQHWSSRRIMDRRQTLWGGYVVKGPSCRFYFAGDTAYCPVFKEIGEKYGPIDMAAIPIGAYEPRDFMHEQHVNPEEALLIHQDVRAVTSLSIHCCTFHLTDEAMDEPPRRLTELLAEQSLDPDCFVTVQHGEMLQVGPGGKLLNTPKRLGA